ncbi:MAG: DUF4363 family protein [Clostridia bacterium]|nr:DUF4363 family protein [Clostridia bacterium]
MRKRITIGMVILILLLTHTIMGSFITNRKLSNLSIIANSAYEAMSNDHLPYQEFKKLKEEWQDSRKILYIFLNHKTVVELEDNIESIEKLSDTGKSESLYTVLIRTINQVNDLKKSIGITIENIL